MELHAGLIVLVPNVPPKLQQALFKAAISYLGKRALINVVLEVSLDHETVHCAEFQWPPE